MENLIRVLPIPLLVVLGIIGFVMYGMIMIVSFVGILIVALLFYVVTVLFWLDVVDWLISIGLAACIIGMCYWGLR